MHAQQKKEMGALKIERDGGEGREREGIIRGTERKKQRWRKLEGEIRG